MMIPARQNYLDETFWPFLKVWETIRLVHYHSTNGVLWNFSCQLGIRRESRLWLRKFYSGIAIVLA